jgi:hypothetical protein
LLWLSDWQRGTLVTKCFFATFRGWFESDLLNYVVELDQQTTLMSFCALDIIIQFVCHMHLLVSLMEQKAVIGVSPLVGAHCKTELRSKAAVRVAFHQPPIGASRR